MPLASWNDSSRYYSRYYSRYLILNRCFFVMVPLGRLAGWLCVCFVLLLTVPLQVLELAVRGGKRETIHKGPLRVIRAGKEAGVRLEYFYIFNDVVSNGNR